MVRASVFRARCGRATEEEKAQAILVVGSFDSLGTGMDGGDETIVSYLSSIEGHFLFPMLWWGEKISLVKCVSTLIFLQLHTKYMSSCKCFPTMESVFPKGFSEWPGPWTMVTLSSGPSPVPPLQERRLSPLVLPPRGIVVLPGFSLGPEGLVHPKGLEILKNKNGI